MLFDTALLESGGRLRTHQRWTALLSATLQMTAFTAVVLLSMAYTDTLPKLALITPIFSPPSAAPSPAERPQTPAAAPVAEATGPFMQPQTIPRHTAYVVDSATSSAADDHGPFVPGAVGDGGPRNGMMEAILRHATVVPPQPPRPSVVHLSQPQPGALIVRVEPRYPPLAIATRTSGTVLLHATISPEGRIVGLEVVSGPPLLVRAAVEAVQQWRYRPYLLNGQPVAVDTQVTVNFIFGQ